MKQLTLLTNITRVWEDACVSVKCPFCGNDMILDTQNGWHKCDRCDHVYECALHIYEVLDFPELTEIYAPVSGDINE